METCVFCGEPKATVGTLHIQGHTIGPVKYCSWCKRVEPLEGLMLDGEPVPSDHVELKLDDDLRYTITIPGGDG